MRARLFYIDYDFKTITIFMLYTLYADARGLIHVLYQEEDL